MSLTLLERETIILFNEEEQTASVFTYNARLKRRLNDLCKKFPDSAKIESRDSLMDKAAESYIIPKKWIKINPPAVLSEKQKARLAENLKANITPQTPKPQAK